MNMEIRTTDWKSSRDLIRKIRTEVFIDEQGVPPELEWDDADLKATHFIAFEGRNPIGCARLMDNGHFGRMAVVKEHRHNHWGSRLLRAIESHARNELKIKEIHANAQTKAIAFYKKNEFNIRGEFFDDAGMPHVEIHKAPGAPRTNWVMSPERDETIYNLTSITDMVGWIELTLGANPRSATLVCNDLNLPVWAHPAVLDAISEFARRSPKRRVNILIPSERTGISRHPLLRLQQRLSSRMTLGIHSGADTNLLITPSWGYMKITEPLNAIACMGDSGTVRRLESQYSHLLQVAQRSKEARRLAI
jgi:predicted GNAT family N-acyltransferase